MEYLWEKDVVPPEFPALSGDASTDVLVIGGGMTGVLCAKKLHDAGIDCMLLESSRIGSGMTKGTTAVLTAQHDTLYTDIEKRFGREHAWLYLDANVEAVDSFRALSAAIPCDFRDVPSVMYTAKDPDALRREARLVRALGVEAEFTTDLPLPFPVSGAVRFPGMAEFHPLKFLYGAAAGLNIYENTKVLRIKGHFAETERGRVRAKKIIVAAHFPPWYPRGLYFMKLYQKRSYVIALEGAQKLDFTLDNHDPDGVYMRSFGDLLLIGGGTHRTGKSGGFETVRQFAETYYPGARERYAWINQDCVSLDGVPYIGRYSPQMRDVFVATGFNLWGMTSSMIASDILTDMVQGRKSEFAGVFAPDRSAIRGQLFANAGEAVIDLAVPTAPRCPHMGCALKWDPARQTWECPCHGSRFDGDGELIAGPALHGINVKNKKN